MLYRKLPVFVITLLAVTFLVGTAHAQFRASLRGTIRDPQGEAVPGATVTLVDTDTNHTQVSTSDSNEIYDFNALPPAPYRMTVLGSPRRCSIMCRLSPSSSIHWTCNWI